MLSRAAEASYWIGRYVERAENVARILDVNYHGVIENSARDAAPLWWSVVATTGDAATFFRHYPRPTSAAVTRFLTVDRNNPNSVASCVAAARENARRIRDRLSSEAWEELNRLHLLVARHADVGLDAPYAFCQAVKTGSHLLSGVIDHTMPHDEGWLFIRAGRSLERAGMTTRIVDSQARLLGRSSDPRDFEATHRWLAVLKSASALEAYRKLRWGDVAPDGIVTFLLLAGVFPRSTLSSLEDLKETLAAIGTGLGLPPSRAQLETSALAARLAATRIDQGFMRDLHDFLDGLQIACNGIGVAIAGEFFWSRVPLRRGA